MSFFEDNLDSDSHGIIVPALKAETTKAIGIEDSTQSLVWLPKSQIEYKKLNDGQGYAILIPHWLFSKYPGLDDFEV